MKPLGLSLLGILTLILFASCAGGAAAPTSSPIFGSMAPPVPAAAPTSAPMAGLKAPSVANGAIDQGVQSALDSATAERMVVYNGDLSLEVNDTEQTVNKIDGILKANQGYISNRGLYRSDTGKWRGTITIRIPAAALDSVMTQIKALGLKTLKEDSKSEDVTQEYTDLDARRKNLEAYEVELTQLLTTVRERTGKAEDILAVYNQLTEVRGQIEQIKGRQNYLQNTSSLATYTIELIPHEEVTVVEGGWSPDNTARTALHALVQALQVMGDVVITFVLLVLPLLAIAAVPILVIVWFIRRSLRHKPTRTTPSPA